MVIFWLKDAIDNNKYQVIIWTNDDLLLLLYVSLHLNEVNDVYYTIGSGYERV